MPTIELPTIDLSKLDLPFKLPFDLPTIDLPSVQLPDVDVPDAEQVIGWFRDAVYAGTGLVALTAERVADVQKRLIEALGSSLQR
jgi:hypothetical protein